MTCAATSPFRGVVGHSTRPGLHDGRSTQVLKNGGSTAPTSRTRAPAGVVTGRGGDGSAGGVAQHLPQRDRVDPAGGDPGGQLGEAQTGVDLFEPSWVCERLRVRPPHPVGRWT